MIFFFKKTKQEKLKFSIMIPKKLKLFVKQHTLKIIIYVGGVFND